MHDRAFPRSAAPAAPACQMRRDAAGNRQPAPNAQEQPSIHRSCAGLNQSAQASWRLDVPGAREGRIATLRALA